jgi:metal-responsive CopG/Arc/MetJ family transcriptional regulator
MGLLKRTYALPRETIEQFEQAVKPGQRSAAIAELLRGWLETRRREQLRREVIEGCREMAETYLETEREYHPLEEEVQRQVGGTAWADFDEYTH